MATKHMSPAKEAIHRVFANYRIELYACRSDAQDFNAAYQTLRNRVWDEAEARIKESFRNGLADESRPIPSGHLLAVTHIICAQITAHAMTYSESRTAHPHREVIQSLCDVLTRMPFTPTEGAFVRETLKPVIDQWCRQYSQGEFHDPWMKALVEAIAKITRNTGPAKPEWTHPLT